MTINEQPQKSEWWINELGSLGISYAKKYDELDDRERKVELRDLTEKIKETMYQQYEITYDRQNCNKDKV